MVFAFLLAACRSSSDGASHVPLPGEYDDAAYHCCAEGDGEACCADYEPGMCEQYGGWVGDCMAEGSDFDTKEICVTCCDGLTETPPYVETDEVVDGYAEGCGPPAAPPGWRICLACGDGTCSADENRCTCPDDCSP